MGGVDAVRRVHHFIMEKIREKPDPNPKPEETNKNFERHRQVLQLSQCEKHTTLWDQVVM